MVGFIDYEADTEIKTIATRLIEEALERITGNEVNQDWVDLIQFYTSKKCNSSRDEIVADFNDMLPVA